MIEIIATTLKEALDAEKHGADRIELVTGILEGGLTPSIALIEEVSNQLSIPVNVMVRPHSKSFVYDDFDMKVVISDIKKIAKTKASAIVFGSLNSDKTINELDLERVFEAKEHLKLTFHRAIDSCENYLEELNKLVKYDIDTVLTSGGNPKATDDFERMTEAVNICKSNEVTLLAGSGLYIDTVQEFLSNVKVDEIHLGSGVKFGKDNLKEIDPNKMKQLIKIAKEKPE